MNIRKAFAGIDWMKWANRGAQLGFDWRLSPDTTAANTDAETEAARIGRAVDRMQDYLEGAVRDNIEAVLIAWAILDKQEVAS